MCDLRMRNIHSRYTNFIHDFYTHNLNCVGMNGKIDRYITWSTFMAFILYNAGLFKNRVNMLYSETSTPNKGHITNNPCTKDTFQYTSSELTYSGITF